MAGPETIRVFFKCEDNVNEAEDQFQRTGNQPYILELFDNSSILDQDDNELLKRAGYLKRILAAGSSTNVQKIKYKQFTERKSDLPAIFSLLLHQSIPDFRKRSIKLHIQNINPLQLLSMKPDCVAFIEDLEVYVPITMMPEFVPLSVLRSLLEYAVHLKHLTIYLGRYLIDQENEVFEKIREDGHTWAN
ncbi:hypothetical protein GQ44DRAFT_831431 [Phaeosphaeriaceae sp. PMI808]|nr:hypothetical protein GQ44DRAFT_831431 [Phaeosphaeriaceae sp. PMI808]